MFGLLPSEQSIRTVSFDSDMHVIRRSECPLTLEIVMLVSGAMCGNVPFLSYAPIGQLIPQVL